VKVTVLCLGLVLCGCTSLTKSGELGTFKIGERAQVGPLIYNAMDTQWNTSLGHGDTPRVPKNGRFFIVYLSIVNGGGTADQNVPTFNLVDDQGGSHPELDSGEGVPNWVGVERKIRPAQSIQGNVVFDVEPKHYRLKVTMEGEEKYAWIDLPLDFGAPPPTADQPAPRRAPGPTRQR
jgi:hypothetical protein